MPLIGLVDPSHDERAADEAGRLPTWVTTDELLNTAELADPSWSPWTYEMIRAALDEWQERDYISTTMLTGGCARSKVLERKEDFILDLDSLYASLRGTQVHRTLEHAARPNSIAEGRFFTTVYLGEKLGEVTLSCSPDLITDDTLWDFKVPTDQSGIPSWGYLWGDHKYQLQLNQYIVRHAERWELKDGQELPFDPRDWKARHLAVCYLGPKGPKVIEHKSKQPYIFKNGKEGTKNLPDVWGDEQVEEFLLPHLTAMVQALNAYPIWPEELNGAPGFEGPPGWACPGRPWCKLPDTYDIAKRFPHGLRWDNEEVRP